MSRWGSAPDWRSLLTTSSQCRAKARPWAEISPAWKRNHDFWVSARTDQACRIIAHTQDLQQFIIALQFSGCRQLRIKPLVFLPSKLTHIVTPIRFRSEETKSELQTLMR